MSEQQGRWFCYSWLFLRDIFLIWEGNYAEFWHHLKQPHLSPAFTSRHPFCLLPYEKFFHWKVWKNKASGYMWQRVPQINYALVKEILTKAVTGWPQQVPWWKKSRYRCFCTLIYTSFSDKNGKMQREGSVWVLPEAALYMQGQQSIRSLSVVCNFLHIKLKRCSLSQWPPTLSFCLTTRKEFKWDQGDAPLPITNLVGTKRRLSSLLLPQREAFQPQAPKPNYATQPTVSKICCNPKSSFGIK